MILFARPGIVSESWVIYLIPLTAAAKPTGTPIYPPLIKIIFGFISNRIKYA